MDFQKNINGLRAIAVLLVLLHHFGVPGFRAGFIGVDIFFVISGYLITRNIVTNVDAGSFRLGAFYSARLRRIVPALVVVCVGTMLAFGTILSSADYLKLWRHLGAALLFFSNVAFQREAGYFDAVTTTKPLIHTWSLAVEWQFYFAFPLLLKVIPRKRLKLALLSLSGMSLAFCLWQTQHNPVAAFYLPFSRIWELLAGGLLALYPPQCAAWNKLKNLGALRLGGAMVLAGLMLTVTEQTLFPGWVALFPVLTGLLFIANGDVGFMRKCLQNGIAQFFGNISYSLYLWHWPIVVFLTLLQQGHLSSIARIGGISASIVLGYLCWRWIETPLRNDRQFWSNRRIGWSYAATCVLTGLGLVAAIKSGGMPFRLPQYVQRAELASADVNPRRAECFLERDDAKAAHPPTFCHSGRAGPATAILWGDSFADALQPAFDAASRQSNSSLEVATVSGCAPMDVFPYADAADRARFQSCASGYQAKVLQHIETSPTLHTVVMAMFYRLYAPGILTERLPVVVCRLKGLGRHVVLVAPIPVAQWDVPSTWAMEQLIRRKPIDSMAVPRDAQSDMEQVFATVESRIESLCGGVDIIRPMDVLCDERLCNLVEQGRSNYSDQWHLSATGAARLESRIAKLLRDG
ncbi:acyltransferase [Herbaspirillum sp. DW155]|uniref:acyltransferase family protein n=1 Tax=Herbaspirillum sp. DW155 TaxID=3095609 RepID=UPI0030856F8E|nr:acyltransferase [Herbaspirillum sp. DW155]